MSAAEGLVLYTDLLQERLKEAPAFDPEKHFFSVPDFLEFAVHSHLAPQVVESPFYEELLLLSEQTFQNKHILQPRGSAKSGRINALVTFLLAYPTKHIWGPMIRVAVVGETMGMSKRHLRKIRGTLETNIYLRATAGNIVPDKRLQKELNLKSEPLWTDISIQTTHFLRNMRTAGYQPEDPSCFALSMNKATTGMRYDVLLLDDPVGTESGRSELKRKKTREVFQELARQQAARTMTLVLGTRHHDEDIHWSIQTEFGDDYLFDAVDIWNGAEGHQKIWREDFEKKDGRWIWKGKIPLSEVKLFWNGWGQLEEDVPRGGFPADPEERKRRALHYLRAKMGSMSPGDWAKNYLNTCMAHHDRVFHEHMFNDYGTEKFSQSPVLNYLLIDAAEGKDFRSSWRVVAVVALDHRDTAYVRDVDFGIWSPAEFAKRAIEQYHRYGCRRLLVEKMAWTQTVRATIELTTSVEGKPMPNIAEVPGRSVSNKRSRIEALEPRLAAGRMLFSPHLRHKQGCNGRTVTQEIIHEFLSIQDIETMPRLKVDIADALSDIDSVDDKGFRLCRPPRGYTAGGELLVPGRQPQPTPSRRSIVGSSGFKGKRTLFN